MCQCDFVMWVGALECFAFWFSHLCMDMDVQILIVFNTEASFVIGRISTGKENFGSPVQCCLLNGKWWKILALKHSYISEE